MTEENPETLLETAESMLDEGNVQQAIASLDRALEIDPEYLPARQLKSQVLTMLGNVAFEEEGDFDAALACYEMALENFPRDAFAWFSKGVTLGGCERHEEAIACYEKAAEIEPKRAITWYNRGCCLQAIGHVEEAIASYGKAIEIEPEDPDAHVNQGRLLDDIGFPGVRPGCPPRD